ncbi:MFS transporter [Streptomyces sp. NPDC054796]
MGRTGPAITGGPAAPGRPVRGHARLRAPVPEQDDDGPGRGRLVAAASVLCATLALIMASVSALYAALPALAGAIGAGQAQQTWIVDAYTLVLAALALPGGALGDRFGRRRVLLTGLALLAAGAGAAPWSPGPETLIAARAVMGLGAALAMPPTLSILTVLFSGRSRETAVGVWVGTCSAGGAAGLMLAGPLVQGYGWEAVFGLTSALSVALLLLAAAVVPPGGQPTRAALDLIGAALGAVAVGGVVYGIIEGSERGWTDALVLSSFVCGALATAAFALRETRHPRPLLDVRVFARPAFTFAALSLTVQFSTAFAFLFLGTQYLQYVLGWSSAGAGAGLLPLAAGVLLTAPAAAKAAARWGPHLTTGAGTAAMAVGCLGLAALRADSPFGEFGCWAALYGAGIGLAAVPATAQVLEGLPAAERNVASAVNDTTRELGAALGIALSGTQLAEGYRDHMAPATTHLPPEAATVAEDSISGALKISARLGPPGRALSDAARESFLHGMAWAMTTAAVLLALGAFVAATGHVRAHRRAP